MSTITEEDHELRMQVAVDKALKKQARLAEADALRRIETAKAQALTSVKICATGGCEGPSMLIVIRLCDCELAVSLRNKG